MPPPMGAGTEPGLTRAEHGAARGEVIVTVRRPGAVVRTMNGPKRIGAGLGCRPRARRRWRHGVVDEEPRTSRLSRDRLPLRCRSTAMGPEASSGQRRDAGGDPLLTTLWQGRPMAQEH